MHELLDVLVLQVLGVCVVCEGARVYLNRSVLVLGCEKSPRSLSTHMSQSGASEDTHGIGQGSPLGGLVWLLPPLHLLYALARLRVRKGHRVLCDPLSGQLVTD